MTENFDQEKNFIVCFSYGILTCGILVFISFLKGGKGVKMGKFADSTKPALNAKLAWLIQESPSFFVPVFVVFHNSHANVPTPNMIIIFMFISHYFYRSFIYVYLMNKKSTDVSLQIMTFAFFFTSINGFNISMFQVKYGFLEEKWLNSLSFCIGTIIWIVGLVINIHSDFILINLRKSKYQKYQIPYGGFFEFVSGANFFGEIIEWWGLAIASGLQIPIVCFAVSTTFTIGTRAMAHHKFYLETFKDYPKERRGIIPFLL